VRWFLSGRRKPRNDWDAMSTVIRAESRLRVKGEIAPARRAGIVYRDSEDNEFLADLESQLRTVLHTGEGATKTAFDLMDDDQGMKWIVLEDGNFQDLVSSTYTVGNAMAANDASDNLLAAVFELYFTGAVGDDTFRTASRTYWIYRYDRRAFYPFVPTGDEEGQRDRPVEAQMAMLIRKEGMVIERSLEEWLGLWGIPF
jgi:hypothetical protein